MRRMLAVVLDKATNSWAIRTGPWRSGTSTAAAGGSSSHPSQLALLQRRRTTSAACAAATAAARAADTSSNVQTQSPWDDVYGAAIRDEQQRQQQQPNSAEPLSLDHTPPCELAASDGDPLGQTQRSQSVQHAGGGSNLQAAPHRIKQTQAHLHMTKDTPATRKLNELRFGTRQKSAPLGRLPISANYNSNGGSNSSRSSTGGSYQLMSEVRPAVSSSHNGSTHHQLPSQQPSTPPKADVQAGQLTHQNQQQAVQQQQQQWHQQYQQPHLLDQPQQQQQEEVVLAYLWNQEPLRAASGAEFVLAHSHDRVEVIPPDVAVIDSVESAKAVVDMLLQYAREGIQWQDKHGATRHDREVYFACDTEVADIDVKMQSPVGHGTVICLSIYAHPRADFSSCVSSSIEANNIATIAAAQEQPSKKNRIWVDLTAGWYQAPEQQTAAAAAAESNPAAAQQLAVGKGMAAAPATAKRTRSTRTHSSRRAAANVPGTEDAAAAAAATEQPPSGSRGSVQAAVTPAAAESAGAAADGNTAAGTKDSGANSDEAAGAAASGITCGAAKRRTRSRRKSEKASHRSSSSSSSNGNGSRNAGVVDTAAEQTAPTRQPVVAAASVAETAEQDVLAEYGPAVDAPLPAVEAGGSNSSSSRRASTAAAITTSSSSSAAGSKARPAASSMYGDHIPAPTVDDLLADDTTRGILKEFKRFFEDPSVKKVWHNYGFDRHVLESFDREELGGFKLAGFGGDTLHMSRLWDASRKFDKGGYSLESLSTDKKIQGELAKAFREEDVGLPKRGMKERFGLKRRKADGQPSSMVQLPAMHVLQTDETFRPEWVDYSALDAKATWNVHRALKSLLQQEDVVMDSYLCQQLLPRNPELYQPALEKATFADTFPIPEPQAAGAAKGRASSTRPRPANVQQKPPRPHIKQQQKAAASNGGSGASGGGSSQRQFTLWDLYCEYWLPFGELLTSMEAAGVRVNRAHLAEQELKAVEDQRKAEQYFREWAKKYVPGAQYMNVNSQVQIRQLLFPDSCAEPVKEFKAANPEYDPNEKPRRPRWKSFNLHGLWGEGQPGRLAVDVTTAKGAAAISGAVLWTLVGTPGAAKKALDELLAKEAEAAAAGVSDSSSSSRAAAPPAAADDAEISIHEDTDDEHHDKDGISDASSSKNAAAAAAAAVVEVVAAPDTDPERLVALQDEAAKMKLGKMYAAMGGGREGIEACLALEKLIEVSAIDKLLSAFIQPLQQDNISTTHTPNAADTAAALSKDAQLIGPTTLDYSSSSSNGSAAAMLVDTASSSSDGTSAQVPADVPNDSSSSNSMAAEAADSEMLVEKWHRVHCSLNLNTETGRLSARRPNLQNQPALEKDRYKVRKAFCSAPGKTLVVADYGQLELRLLAHMANCKSMIDAFELGGDFHSRTAMGMYDYIQQDIKDGKCQLEAEGDHEDGPPLLKDKYASERRKAKILNFSIAYGKTAHGLSKDWGVTLEEAEATVQRWYADRPEVREWQARQRAYASDTGWVNTMIGRRRYLLPSIRSDSKWERARAERAAINTPIQGSAADVASAAMLAIDKDEWLNDHNWKLLLQVHDEVMLEGPRETAEQAKARVVACMANPWENLVGFVGKPLRVDLVVDANVADTWYEAK